ncbi:MAG: hypothetical protein DMG93_15715 [Acidobacteria bacterium]|nr:MAG: hypothetical protein DMG93_15715 [Acidobacteriota bacterium]
MPGRAILALQADHEYLLLLPPGADDLVRGSAANLTRLAPRSSYYSLGEQIELPRILRRHKVDLLHSPHFLLPLAQTCPAVVTIHDVRSFIATWQNVLPHNDVCRPVLARVVVTIIQQRWRERALKRASDFSWHKAAEQTLAVYKKVYESVRSRGTSTTGNSAFASVLRNPDSR